MSSYTHPTISVIVVNFNSGALLGLCIDRIRQSTVSVELIVVDNHSKDISRVWALGHNGEQTEKYIQNDQNLGFSTAVNIGAGVASGEMLVVINPDCLVWPHTIDRLSRFLNDQEEVGLVGGLVFGIHGLEQNGCRRYDVTPIRSIGKILRKLVPFNNMPTIDMTQEPIPQSSIDVDAVSGSFFAVRKSLYNQLGGLDENYFLHFEDLDFCRKVRAAGYRVVFNPDVSVVHVGAVSGGVRSVDIALYKHRSLKLYFRKHLPRYSLAVLVVSITSQLYIWLRCLYESVIPENRNYKRSDRIEGIWGATNINDVFVIGEQGRFLYSVVMRLAARGFNVVVETSDPQMAPKVPQVTWVASEYRAKVPDKDYPEFTWILCIGSTEQLKDYQKSFESHKFGSRLLIETGVGVNLANQSNIVENAIVMEQSVGLLQLNSLCLRLGALNRNQEKEIKQNSINELASSKDFKIEDRSESNNHEHVHVDDISELCLDVLVGVSDQESKATIQQILKDAIDRFNQRTRTLYN